MILKKYLLLLLLSAVSGWAQSTISVPNVSQACSGADCPNNSNNQQGGNGAANTGTNQRPTGSPASGANQTRTPTDLGNQPAGTSVSGQSSQEEQADQTHPEVTPDALAAKAHKPEIEKPTEFQNFVLSSTGLKLPIYGRSLFNQSPTTFAPVDGGPVPGDYIIGPKDQLIVQAWGQIELEARVVVDRNGEIYLPKIGTISVAGVKYDQLHDYLKKSIERLFKNFELTVTLGRLRSIQVIVVGHARQPGTYTVGSLSTLVNALFASGGPDGTGSMRHIVVKRNDQPITEFDLYDLLVKGDKSKDVLLQSGDVIFIPPAGPQVAIVGSVNQPAVYELRDNVTVGEQLEVAGGLSTTADANRAVLERISDRTVRKVEEFALDKDGLGRRLQDGDVLRVFPVSPKFENAVTLRGNLAQPGRYPWHEGMRFHDLVPSRDAVITREYWARQNLLVKPLPTWTDPTSKEPALPTSLVDRNAAEVNWEYAVVQRLNPEDLSSRLIAFNLGNAISDPNSPDNVALQAGDVITIFSQRDLQVPVSHRTKFVRIEGEVKAAGVYRAEAGETLRDIVMRAGGLTPNAYLYASEFRRESTREAQQKKIESAADQMERDLNAEATRAGSAASGDARALAAQQIDYDRKAIDRFRSTKATGRIVLDVAPDDADASALPPLPLEDGDFFLVPASPATLEVVGAVYNQNAFIYKSGLVLGDYLRKAGGTTREADGGRVFVIRADGSVVSKQNHHSRWSGDFTSLKVLAGDTIVVPTKVKTGSTLLLLRDWSQVFSQFALGAAAIKVLAP